MTIQTLEYIHKLLLREKESTEEAYKAERKLQHEYENSEYYDKELISRQEKAADDLMKIYFEKYKALEDFELHEW